MYIPVSLYQHVRSTSIRVDQSVFRHVISCVLDEDVATRFVVYVIDLDDPGEVPRG